MFFFLKLILKKMGKLNCVNYYFISFSLIEKYNFNIFNYLMMKVECKNNV